MPTMIVPAVLALSFAATGALAQEARGGHALGADFAGLSPKAAAAPLPRPGQTIGAVATRPAAADCAKAVCAEEAALGK